MDAAWDVSGLYSLAAELGVKVRGCIYTHYHFDHCGGDMPPMFVRNNRFVVPGAKEVEQRGGRVWAGKGDAQKIKGQCHLKRDVLVVDDGTCLIAVISCCTSSAHPATHLVRFVSMLLRNA